MIIAKSTVRYLVGFVTVRIDGLNKERFINLCHNKNISIWKLTYRDDIYEANIALWDYKKIKRPLKKTHVHIEILDRHGLPFFMYKYRKRKMFCFAVVLFCVVMYVMSLFVWDISLEGEYSYTEIEITDFLKSIGISEGIWKSNIKCDEIEAAIRNNYYDITWVSAELTGTRLIIHVKENFDEMNIQATSNSSQDLVADTDGEIVSIITRTGVPQVQIGDIVKKGDVLVSGVVEILDDNKEVKMTELVSSDADIYAKVEYKYNYSFNIDYEFKEYTGKSKKGKYIQLFNYRLGTYYFNKFENFDLIKDEKQLYLFDSLYLPFCYGNESMKEYNIIKKTYSEKEAILIAQTELENFFAKIKEKGIQIIANNVKIDVVNGVCMSTGTITIVKPIGVGAPITLEGT